MTGELVYREAEGTGGEPAGTPSTTQGDAS